MTSLTRTDRARALVPLGALAVGTVASVASALYLAHVQAHDTDERFRHRSEETVQSLTEGLADAGDTLRGVRGLFDGSERVEADEFARYVAGLDVAHRHGGLLSVSYVRNDAARTVAYTFPSGLRPMPAFGPVREAQDRARDE